MMCPFSGTMNVITYTDEHIMHFSIYYVCMQDENKNNKGICNYFHFVLLTSYITCKYWTEYHYKQNT